MSIDRIRYFAAVVETKNLRKAADLVGISPPSMSKAISVLEDELGRKLIHPDGRGIGITPEGIEVYHMATPLLEEERRFYDGIRKRNQSKPQIRIASFEVFSSYFISTFLSTYQTYDCLLLEMDPGKIEQAILVGTIDFGLTYLPSLDRALDYTEIGSFEMGIFGRKEWDSTPFEEWPFAIPTTELRIHSSEVNSLDMWPRNAPKRTIKYQFELLETALQTSRKGISVLHCPKFIIRIHNESMRPAFHLVSLPYPPGYGKPRLTKAYLVNRKGTSVSEIEGKLAKFMRSLR